MDLEKQLLANRPNLSKNSIKTYCSILNNLYRTIEGKDQPIPNVNWFIDNQSKILKALEPLSHTTRKLKLASLVSLTSNHPKVAEKYQSQMLKDIKVWDDQQSEQTKTPQQSENWISQDQVQQIHDNMRQATAYLFKKNSLTPKERTDLQDYLILSLYVLQPPRRLMDYIDMRLHGTRQEGDNYIDKKKFVFNSYKTVKKYGQQTVDISPKLLYIINKWKRLNPDQEWLLVDSKGQKMSSPVLSMRINRIFGGKKISVNMLRHIYISDKVLKDMPKLSELEEVAKDMGHSTGSQVLYKKVD